MSSVRTVCDKLEKLMKKYSEFGDFEFGACGTQSHLNVFYDDGPKEPPTGVSLEDYQFMKDFIGNVENAMFITGHVDLSEAEKDYLITSQMPEAISEKYLCEMINKIVENRDSDSGKTSDEDKKYVWVVTAKSDDLDDMLVCIATSEDDAAEKGDEHNEQYANIFGQEEADCIEYVVEKYPADTLITTIADH